MLVLILLVVALFIVLDITHFGASPALSGTTRLQDVEIRDYNGEPLSSVNDFHENSIKGPQYINETDYRLTIDGLTHRTLVLTYQDVINNHPQYSKIVTLHCVEGWDVTILWEGVLVRDLLNEAGVDPRAKTVIFIPTTVIPRHFPWTIFTTAISSWRTG
jgi:DMSO/TMAO reductase YedYZ molybdopterin-dependent catalytic subunit